MTLKAKLFELLQVKPSQENVATCVSDYQEIKKKLEVQHNVSLSGKIINEVTFEICELEDEKK